MVYPAERDSDLFAPALSSLRDIAAAAQRADPGLVARLSGSARALLLAPC